MYACTLLWLKFARWLVSTTVHIGRQEQQNRNDSMPLTGFSSTVHLNASSFFLQPGPLVIRTAHSFALFFCFRFPHARPQCILQYPTMPRPPPPVQPLSNNSFDLSHKPREFSFSSLASSLFPRIVPLDENVPRALTGGPEQRERAPPEPLSGPKRGKGFLSVPPPPRENNSTTWQGTEREKKLQKLHVHTRTQNNQYMGAGWWTSGLLTRVGSRARLRMELPGIPHRPLRWV